MFRKVCYIGYRSRIAPCQFHVITKTQISSTSTKDISPILKLVKSSPTSLKLRNYQEECIRAVLSAIENGRRRIGISLATGSGKTVIFTHLIERIEAPSVQRTRTLILAHRRELVEQAARHCQATYPEKTLEIDMGSMVASGGADITVASIQSISSNNRIAKYDPARIKLILVDEAHHIVAPGYLKVLGHFGLVEDNLHHTHTPALVGVSATFSRLDGLALGKVIKHIVYHKDYIDMIGDKWLSDAIFTTVQSKANLSKVKKGPTGDFHKGSLSQAVNTAEINHLTVQAWLARAKNRRSTLVFCIDVAHVISLTATFRNNGVDARYITGDTPIRLRNLRLDAFRNHEFPVLLNCGVFTEGTDIPNVDCILLARPTKSRNLLVQMIGRGMRLYSGKSNCHIIDMVASLNTGMVTTPTLFGLDPSELLENADVRDMERIRTQRVQHASKEEMATDFPSTVHNSHDTKRSLIFTDYDSVQDLLEDNSGDRHVRAISSHAWVYVGDSKFILANNTGDYLSISQDDSATPDCLHREQNAFFQVRYTAKIRNSAATKSPFMRPRQIAKCESFEAAVRAADTFATSIFPYVMIAARPPGNWRGKDASFAQVQYLNKFRRKDDLLEVGNITKGKAMDMITKIKFGARGHFSKLEAMKRRRKQEAREEMKWKEMHKREKVSVGPLYSDGAKS